MILVLSCTSSLHLLSKPPLLISAVTVGPPTTHVLGNMWVTTPPDQFSPVHPTHQNSTCALVLLRNTSWYKMFHHKLSVICVSDAIMQYFHALDATSSAFLSLAISESVFWRRGEPRQLGIQDAASSHHCSLNYFCCKSATNFHVMAFEWASAQAD